MNWTSTSPTIPGYYWLRNYMHKLAQLDPRLRTIQANPVVVQVQPRDYEQAELQFWATAVDVPFQFDELVEGEWYGPIQPPE